MLDCITITKDKQLFAEQVYNRYLQEAYMVEADYSEEFIDNLFLSIEAANIGTDLKKCNETC